MKAYSNRHIWQITYPILISLLMENMIGLTDTAFLGRVGEVELGASALAGVYYMAIFMLGFGFSIGVQILIARRNGEGRLREIGPIFQQGLLFLLFFAAVMFFVSKSFTPLLLRRLIDSDAVYTAAISYLDWRIYGFFFSFAAVLFRAFYVGHDQHPYPYRELGRNGTHECRPELHPDLRQVGLSCTRHRRCGDRFVGSGIGFIAFFRYLHPPERQSAPLQAVPFPGRELP